MAAKRRIASSLIVALASTVLTSSGWAQDSSAIAGVVIDATGAVLPAVTVEAASPALIEKVRVATTDGEGRYNITALRPGTYSVTFTLAGFAVVERRDVVITSGFTANINAELHPAQLQETVTVTGASPLVDVQNVRQQMLVTDDVLAVLPSSTMTLATVGNLTPGVAGTINVGGGAGLYSMSSAYVMTFHGKSGAKTYVDGMRVNNAAQGSSTGYIPSPGTLQEWALETGGAPAESNVSGININYIPKEGGNAFSGVFTALYTSDTFSSSNLDDDLRRQGLTTEGTVQYVWDGSASLGGPIIRDRLWFYTSHRSAANKKLVAGIFFNKTQGTPIYTADPSRQAFTNEHINSHAVRLTWQASQRNKFNFFTDIQSNCVCRGRGEFRAPEASYKWSMWPQGIVQGTWTSARSNRLLLEAGVGATINNFPGYEVPESGANDISILEQSTGFRYNASGFGLGNLGAPKDSDRYIQRFSASYVTGSHSIKTGVYIEEAYSALTGRVHGDVDYVFFQGNPLSINQYATPLTQYGKVMPDFSVYAQDQWAIKRLTLNVGARFEYFRAYIPSQNVPAVRFVPARSYDRVDDVPKWSDLNPRLGASYDLFGDGKTAFKVAFGRYVNAIGLFDLPGQNDPLATSINQVSRNWTDSNKNFVPDCELTNPAENSECGPISNQNFGKTNPNATRYADDVLRGFGVRPGLWEVSTEVQREIVPGLSVTAGYYRNWQDHFYVTVNEATTPADYDPFCVRAPIDPRLPQGGGYDVCGLYNVNEAQFGKVQNLVTQASNYGDHARYSDFINVGVNGRWRGGVFGGGLDTGRTVEDQCFVVNSGQDLLNCRAVTPFSAQTQVKLFGSYPLPREFFVSGTFQSITGPQFQVLANYSASNAEVEPSLGRPLSGRTARVTVPLIPPQTEFLPRRNQLDIRVSKHFRLRRSLRLEVNVDVYNVLNANDINGVNPSYGSAWLFPVADTYSGGAILGARLVEFGTRLSF